MHSAIVVCCALCAITPLHAATPSTFWAQPTKQINNFQINNSQPLSHLPLLTHGALLPARHSSSDYSLRLYSQAKDHRGHYHVRYNEYYKGLPVFGQQIIANVNPNHHKPMTISGFLLKGLAHDIHSITAALTASSALQQAEHDFFNDSHHSDWKLNVINQPKKIVFQPHSNSIAHLAYLNQFFATRTSANGKKIIAMPTYILDAHNGQVLTRWNNLHTDEAGSGPGGYTGKTVSSDYPPQLYQFGTASTGEPFGYIDIQVSGSTCSMQNNNFIGYMANLPDPSPFDYILGIVFQQLVPATSYSCSAPNYSHTDTAVNGGRSPINNAMYFSQRTLNMYTQTYGIAAPFQSTSIGGMYVFTNVENYDNAYAAGPIYNDDGTRFSNQQIWFGNGDTVFMPLTSPGVVAHELSHIYTGFNSDLIYENQSGGMNEAFSDIMAMAFKQYLSDRYSWYTWGSSNAKWQVGYDITIGPWVDRPSRYMYNPPLDGVSIDNFSNYYDGLNVHHSSGIYNVAFYRMATQHTDISLGVQNVAQLFVNANRDYWPQGSTFAYGACGVLQEAHNNGFSNQQIAAIADDFEHVGTPCRFNITQAD